MFIDILISNKLFSEEIYLLQMHVGKISTYDLEIIKNININKNINIDIIKNYFNFHNFRFHLLF